MSDQIRGLSGPEIDAVAGGGVDLINAHITSVVRPVGDQNPRPRASQTMLFKDYDMSSPS